jgi:predicted esterase
MNAAARRPNLVKAGIGIEGAPPSGGVNVNELAKVPVFVIMGDNTSPAAAKAFTDQLVALGDDASTLWLPDAGIHGNGHTMMLELNSEQIADLIEDWIKEHLPGVCGHYRR